jgi:hypothetical protein
MEDERTDKERAPIIINIAKARGVMLVRLVAVGVFLSVLSITSKQLLSYMKNVWKIRGTMESLQLADRRFVLEFSIEGDYEHVMHGGPWSYQGDVVLVRKLKDGEDPNTVQFESMPIWAQFTRIPFYLLSKQLARKLARNLGEYISIDNDARGDICDKILRARVRSPIGRALQRWITLEDEVSDEEVVVTVLYERLPSFCLCCGVIGHQENDCDLPITLRKRRYAKDIGVPPTHAKDIRKWFLPESVGENAIQMDTPWRNVAAFGAKRGTTPKAQLAIVAHVAKEVEKLTVQDNEGGPNGASNYPSGNDTDKNVQATSPPTTPVESKTAIDTSKPAPSEPAIIKNSTDKAAEENTTSKKWKRAARESGEAQSIVTDDQGRAPPSINKGQLIKDGNISGPKEGVTMLGKRRDRVLQVEDGGTLLPQLKKRKEEGAASTSEDGDPGSDDKEEATSPGAAGQLTGASVSACQKP